MQDKYNIVDLIKSYPSRNIHGLGVAALALLGLAAAPAALAQSYTLTTLVSFNYPTGAGPTAALTLSGNTLYGTTGFGGVNNGDGTVFSVPTKGGPPTVLATFNGANGGQPRAGVTLSGGTLYGTTEQGGAGYGTVFSVPITGGKPTVLATFSGANSGGAILAGGLALSGNTLYGTTQFDGFNNGDYYGDGILFSVPKTGGTPTILSRFSAGNDNGEWPISNLILGDGVFYGTTFTGGANGDGTVFSVPIAGGDPTVLASFDHTNGDGPYDLTLSGSTLYGTTSGGGANDDGTVFSVPITGGSSTVLASFNGMNGQNPVGGVILSGSTLYGTTSNGGAYGDGTVFSVPATGGSPTVLASFNGTNGSQPWAGLTLSGSTLYGTTYLGGANDNGTVFALTLDQSPVPEASSLISLGLLLALGLGGMVIAKKRGKTQGNPMCQYRMRQLTTLNLSLFRAENGRYDVINFA